MADTQIFNNPSFGEIRTTVSESGEPMFCLADVCKAVGLTNASSVKSRLDSEDVQVFDLHALNLTEGGVGNTKANFVTESGFYDVLLYSDAPQVKPFRKWITSEVLPTIRKYGGYMVAKENETAEELMARALVVARETLRRKEQRLLEAEAKIEADAPKVLFAEAVETSDSVCLVGELAKILKQNGVKDMGQNRLYKWLRSHSFLGNKGDNYNLPTQKAMDLGVFKVIKGKRIDKHTGGVIVTRTAKVTTKGLKYFIK